MFEKVSPKNKKCERKCKKVLDFESSLLKYKKFFKLGARKFHFLKYKKFFQSRFFLIIRAQKFLSWNMKKIWDKKVPYPKYKKFFNIGARKFHFLKCKKFFRVKVFSLNTNPTKWSNTNYSSATATATANGSFDSVWPFCGVGT